MAYDKEVERPEELKDLTEPERATVSNMHPSSEGGAEHQILPHPPTNRQFDQLARPQPNPQLQVGTTRQPLSQVTYPQKQPPRVNPVNLCPNPKQHMGIEPNLVDISTLRGEMQECKNRQECRFLSMGRCKFRHLPRTISFPGSGRFCEFQSNGEFSE